VSRMSRSLVVAALLAASACSTSYVPRTPGRVFVTMDGGTFAYVRDGQRHAHGFFGGGLADAVRGNPQAEAAANEYSDRLRNGFLASMLGIVCSGIATGYAIDRAYNDDGGESGLLVATGCLVLSMGGLFYMASGEPYRWDAINIFNDSPPPMVVPTWGPPSADNYDPLRSVTPISSRAAAKRLMSVVPAPSSSNLESRASFSKPSSSM
jgi:hypothetical protein